MALPELVADIEALVTVESPTGDVDAVGRCAAAVAELGRRRTGAAPEWLESGGRPHLRWRFGARPGGVLLLGHFDTVWPIGSLVTHPFDVVDGRLTGPGCFDMKSGVVQLFHALGGLAEPSGVTVLLTSDEETGSATSRPLIEQEAKAAGAVLVLEAAEQDSVKIARKGVSWYGLEITGRAAHAGLEPQKGINATIEAAGQVLAIADLAHEALGTTVTPTLLHSGTTANTVPAAATLQVDVRAETESEQHRVDAALRARRPDLPGAQLTLTGGIDRPPLERAASAELFALARHLYAELGFGELTGVGVGGGSDGNLTAGFGARTLDGLGAIGGGAHADHEHVLVAELPRRVALLAELVRTLTGPGA